MMYIGTSLGGCLLSLLAGEVSEDEVMFIVTRTDCPDYDKFIGVVKSYHAQGNPHSHNPARYSLGDYPLDDAIELATRLYYSGRIHQPRVFASFEGGDNFYQHPAKLGHGLWMQVVPTNDNSTPAVVEAYQKYKVLDTLTK
jgi:hypothetical protein